MNKSSIEWFWQQVARTLPVGVDSPIAIKLYDTLKQAKEMHKQEIIDATCLNDYVNEDDREIGERYYNQEFGGNNGTK